MCGDCACVWVRVGGWVCARMRNVWCFVKSIDEMSIDELSVYKIAVEKLAIEKMAVYEMSVDKTTVCG